MTSRLQTAVILTATLALALAGCARQDSAPEQADVKLADDTTVFESDDDAFRAATYAAFEFVSEWDRAFHHRNDDMTTLQPFVTDDYYADLADDEPDGSYLTGTTTISRFSLLEVGGGTRSPTVTIKFCADFTGVTGHDKDGDTWKPNDVNDEHRLWSVSHFVWDEYAQQLIADGWRYWFDEEPC